LQILLIPERVLEREQAAPRVSEQVEVAPVQPERLANLLHFIDEAGQLPEARLVRLVAVGRSELIVVVVLDSGARQVAVERLEILMGGRRAAVQQQYLDPGIVSYSLGPDVERTLGSLDGDESRTARE